MEALELQPIDAQLNSQNSVGASDTLSPVDSIAANSSVGSSIQETELGQSLDAALGRPIEPAAPAASAEITESAAPAEIAEIAEPAVLAEPVAITESAESAPAETAETTESAEIAELAAPAEITESAEIAEIAEPTVLAEPVAITESAESAPAEAVETTESAEIAESAAPAEIAEPAVLAEPVAITESVESAPAESTESAEVVEPAEVAEITESAAPAESAEIVESAAPAAPTEVAAPVEPAVVITDPTPQAAAQEAQDLKQEQAPTGDESPSVGKAVGDSEESTDSSVANSLQLTSTGSIDEALAGSVTGLDPTTVENAPASEGLGDHNNAKVDPGSAPVFNIAADAVSSAKSLNVAETRLIKDLTKRFRSKGDLLDPGAGTNTVIGAGGSDLIFGNGKGFNTITTGTGSDAIVLGTETTNRIFDFNANRDRFVLSDDLDINNIMIAQGTNPGKGGLNQPLDSVNNTLIMDKSSGRILASLTFVKSDTINASNFFKTSSKVIDAVQNATFSNTQQGNGQLTGSTGRDKLVGGDGDDFLAPGDDTFSFRTARDGQEFPFATDSPGDARYKFELKGGVFRVNATYKNFDGAPLFSQGETTIDPTAIILNGAQAQPFIDGFLKVPVDVEGNKITGSHIHFSPAEDARGDFADATVVRYIENTVKSPKAGSLKGEFELTPEEQAALLGGLLYSNIHTNVDLDGDGKGGFPTGESRTNANNNIVKFV